jgi:hypothetical protein
MKLKVERAVLVYQSGIANVFQVASFNLSDYGRNAKLLRQADFRTCENFAQGLAIAGTRVTTAYCNQAGNIASCTWSEDLEDAPFSTQFNPVVSGVGVN